MTTTDVHGGLHDGAGRYTIKTYSDAETTLGVPVSRQTSAPLDRRSMQAMNRSAREVARLADDDQLILDPPYQRPTIWRYDQRVNLVRSWLEGLPVPSVVLNDRGATYSVVDGKQRIETAILWFNGDLPVPASWFRDEFVTDTIDTDDGPYIVYTSLTLEGQRHMSNEAKLPVIETKLPTVEEEAALYDRLNTAGTEQTAEDIANARRVAAGR